MTSINTNITIDETLLSLVDKERKKGSKEIKRSAFISDLIQMGLIENESVFRFHIDDELCTDIAELKRKVEIHNLVPMSMEEFINCIFSKGMDFVERQTNIRNAKSQRKIRKLEEFKKENYIVDENTVWR